MINLKNAKNQACAEYFEIFWHKSCDYLNKKYYFYHKNKFNH